MCGKNDRERENKSIAKEHPYVFIETENDRCPCEGIIDTVVDVCNSGLRIIHTRGSHGVLSPSK
jgi:hypothetical protein